MMTSHSAAVAKLEHSQVGREELNINCAFEIGISISGKNVIKSKNMSSIYF